MLNKTPTLERVGHHQTWTLYRWRLEHDDVGNGRHVVGVDRFGLESQDVISTDRNICETPTFISDRILDADGDPFVGGCVFEGLVGRRTGFLGKRVIGIEEIGRMGQRFLAAVATHAHDTFSDV